MEVRGRRNIDTSPDRARVYVQPKVKPFRKVQVIYYLSRNGQLEHPHFMEVTHLAKTQLRLKDVIDRLTVLRGKGMPSLYSWSCKRSYKNGFVWSDLSENDVIHPTEGAECVLKGSEIIEGCAERFHQQLQVRNINQQIPEPPYYPPTRKSLNVVGSRYEEEEEYEEKRSNSTGSNTPNYFKCSRGVSTDEIEDNKPNNNNSSSNNKNNPSEITINDASPPSASSTVSDKTHNNSQRFEECDFVSEPITRNSVFLQLITCGSSVAMKGRISNPPPALNSTSSGRKSSTSLHKEVLCKTATKTMISEEDETMINYMSENPRFGNPQSEEKEYFSGSIVESITEDHHRVGTESSLKKSSSYNEERSSKSGMAEQSKKTVEEKEGKVTKGKCFPRKKFASKQSKK